MAVQLPRYLALAALLFGFAFRGHRPNFWFRMSLAAGSLGLLALARQGESLRPRLSGADVAVGATSAALLYAIFQAGDRLARTWVPSGKDDIATIYRLRREASPGLIAFLLAAVIAPGEELFWRGFIQRHLQSRLSNVRAVLLAAAAYAAVHLSSRNLTLAAAAGVAGLFWSLQFAVQKRLAPLIVSHILWDIWIFLIAPTPGDHASDGPRGSTPAAE